MMHPIVRETIDRCRAAGLRRTKALEELVSTLLEIQGLSRTRAAG